MSIYVIASEGGMCKIGMARRPEKRLGSLTTGHPYKLRLFGSFQVDAFLARQLEKRAHLRLAAKRMHGEWFAISPEEAMAVVEDVAVIQPSSEAGQFQLDIEKLGWTFERLAECLGLDHKVLRGFCASGPPRITKLAVKALASGWRP